MSPFIVFALALFSYAVAKPADNSIGINSPIVQKFLQTLQKTQKLDANATERILYGDVVPQGEIPNQVVFTLTTAGLLKDVPETVPFCGGTLITSRHVLTSGSCAALLGLGLFLPIVRAYINVATLSPLDSRVEVRSIISTRAHEQILFNEKFTANDIGVVRLDYPVRNVRKVRLPSEGESFPGDYLDMYGFGVRDFKIPAVTMEHSERDGETTTEPPVTVQPVTEPFVPLTPPTPVPVFSTNLRKARATLYPIGQCSVDLSLPALDASKYFCTTQSQQPCFGDYGGPMMYYGVQYGIIGSSIANVCNENALAVHVRVSGYKRWIDAIVDL